MSSILKNVFNPKRWRTVKNSIFKGSQSLFSKAAKSSAGAWGRVKKFYATNPSLYNAIVASVTVGFISRALFRSKDAADEVQARDENNYGTSVADGDAIYAAKLRHHAANLHRSAAQLQYASIDSSASRKTLVVMIQEYHDLINNLPEGMIDLAITTDRMMGSSYRLGVKPELDKRSEVIYTAMVNAKDDDTHDSVISQDLSYLIYLDSLRIPLQPL